jgi:dihydroxyacetone kinase-like protein
MTPDELRAVLDRALEILAASEDEIRDLDAAVGDGDLGITVSRGAVAARKAMAALPAESTPASIFRAIASAIASANPSSFTALAAGGLLAAARSVDGKQTLARSDLAAMGRDAAAAIAKRGKSEVGDKTVLDALVPSITALESDASDDDLAAMIGAARHGIEETTPKVSRRGRASWLGERSQGHPDPGAVVYLRLLEAIDRARTGVRNAT